MNVKSVMNYCEVMSNLYVHCIVEMFTENIGLF